MTNEDKKLIADYMGWHEVTVEDPMNKGVMEKITTKHNYAEAYFDLNDASLCVKEMQKRGEWDGFFYFVWNRYRKSEKLLYKEVNEATFTALLFSADNFFNAFVQWRKTK